MLLAIGKHYALRVPGVGEVGVTVATISNSASSDLQVRRRAEVAHR